MAQPLTHEDIRAIVRETVKETLLGLGLDQSNPIEVQKDFQHLREWRQTSQSVKMKAIMTIIGIALTGSAAAFWLGLKDFFHH